MLGVVAWLVSLSLAAWMLPVVLGLALAIPLALLTGQRAGRTCIAAARPAANAGGRPAATCAGQRGSAASRVAVDRSGCAEGVARLLLDQRLLEAHQKNAAAAATTTSGPDRHDVCCWRVPNWRRPRRWNQRRLV